MIEKNSPANTPDVTQTPSTLWMFEISLFPQYCALKMAAPLLIPNKSSPSRKKIWFARPTAAMGVSPNCPIMMTSTMFKDDMMNCWMMIGSAILPSVELIHVQLVDVEVCHVMPPILKRVVFCFIM